MMVRKPAVAGMFYPGEKEALHQEIQKYLQQVKNPAPPPKALIGPHAGTIYSGPIAATAYATLTPKRKQIKKVILLGPSHHVFLHGLAASTAEKFETPLGKIDIDRQGIKNIAKLPQVQFSDEAHQQEHSLELHLPFLQEVLDDFDLIPLVVGHTPPQEIAHVLDQLWGGPETLIVISTDLSHYQDYETARRMDQSCSQAIEELRFQDIRDNQACGHFPVCGFLLAALDHKLKGRILDLRNSGDTAGDKNRVVGYGAYGFY